MKACRYKTANWSDLMLRAMSSRVIRGLTSSSKVPRQCGFLIASSVLDALVYEGVIPPEVFNIGALKIIDCRNNRLPGATVVNEVEHSWAWYTVENLTSFWHFLLPVLDDITDVLLLLKASGHHGLWWTCLCIFLIADIERVYTAFFFFALSILQAFNVVLCFAFAERRTIDGTRIEAYSGTMSIFAGQPIDLRNTWWLQLDSLLWTLFGSCARSSSFMGTCGLAGQATGGYLRRAGLGLSWNRCVLFFHPMRYFGEFIMNFPKYHIRRYVTNHNELERRHIAMVRAVGETLCVDSLFLALSMVTEGWDDNVFGFAMLSGLLSVLELVTELQYYVTEAESARTNIDASNEVVHGRSAATERTQAANDIERGGS